ncbi:putative quinol monooxygenase [Streptomyces xiaopingdaonensis]|uniref:putative quinol monooxygenase n=1 Tax=Streptomyces xiaopingdaonensis TaxID=1565415 RepID=UPI00031FB4F3|nr:antibiotic biosynthesis monooxygenase family protein [Streptomyces xiaopingdaonensis]
MSCVVVARYRTLESREQEVLELLDRAAAATRTEPGNLAYRVHQGAEDPRTVLLYEEYRTEADLAAHWASEHFRDVVAGRVIPLLESREVVRCLPRGQ